VAAIVSGRLPHRYDRGNVRRVVEQRLRGDRMVYDRFAQRYDRGYGTLYREAVLVDASDAALDESPADVRPTLDASTTPAVSGMVGAGALLLVVTPSSAGNASPAVTLPGHSAPPPPWPPRAR
jgi:hypothetical protein